VVHDGTSFHQNWEIYLVQGDGSGLTRMTDNEVVDTSPTWSPDGRQIAFRSRRDGSSDLFIMDSDGSHITNLIRDPKDSIFDEFYPRWNPKRDLMAMYTDRFYSPAVGCAWHRVAYMPINGGKDSIVVLDAQVTEQETLTWSPDGSTIVYSSRCDFAKEQAIELFAWNIDTNEVTQLTHDGFSNSSPAYSNNGRYLAYQSTRDDEAAEIYILDLETGDLRNLTQSPSKDSHPTWSPDDSQIAFITDRDGNDEIYVMNVDGSGTPINVSNHPARDFEPSWSPAPRN
jgi:Tol biopolymer transport system component